VNGTVATLWGCAALGIAANAWLAARPSATKGDVTSVHADHDCLGTAAVAREHAPSNCERELVQCSDTADGCAALVAECRDEGVGLRELDERFADGRRDVGNEARVRELLAGGLEHLDDTTWSLTCRDAICEIVIEGDVDGASLAIETALRPLIQSASFVPRAAENDHAAGLAIYIEVHPRDRVFAMPLLEDLQRRFEASGALDECHRRHGDEGTFNIRVDLDPDDGPIVHVGGSVSVTPTGACLLERLDEELDRTEIPASHTGATRFLSYELPHHP
jgi:hypothetical protein